MNLAGVFQSLAHIEQRLAAAAGNVILFVRNAYGHLPGDLQHSEAVTLLQKGFPNIAKWTAHAVIGATFGWIEKNEPGKLKHITSFILEEATKASDIRLADLFKRDPLASNTAPLACESSGASGPLPTNNQEPSTTQPAPPPPGLGESSPPPAAQPQPFHPQAPVPIQ